MFKDAYAFDCDLSDWDVSSGTTFESMFDKATAFDGNVSGWNMVRALEDADLNMFKKMFYGAYNFRGLGLEDWMFNDSWSQVDFSGRGLYDMFVDWTGSIIGDVTNWPNATSFSYWGSPRRFQFSPSAYNCSDVDDLTTCTMNGCDAVEMTRYDIPNGGLGDCGDADLDHKDECTPACDAGYVATGHMVCYGSFAINSFECKPIETCSGADTDPDDGTKGNCTATLNLGEHCMPECNEGFTGYGHRICNLGNLIDVFTCMADPEECRIETPEGPEGEAPEGEAPEGETPEGESPDTSDKSHVPRSDRDFGEDEKSGAPLRAAVAPAVLGCFALAAFLPVM